MRCCNSRCTLLSRNRRKSSDHTAAHSGFFAASGHNCRGTVTGTTSTGTEDDINALFFELSGNFRSCFIHKFLHVSTATHEGVGFCREGTNEAFFYQFMKTVDREHGIDAAMAEQIGESARSIQRYIRLTELIPDLLDYVDKKRLQFTVAVDISYIDKEIQTWLFEYIKENGTVKAVQVAALRTALEVGPMTQAKMISILVNSQPGRKQEQKITFSEKKLRNFFSDKYTAEDMESVILELLDQWKRGEITV